MNVNKIYTKSFVDGPGARVVVRVQGCPHRCAGCFVPETHPFSGGRKWSPEDLAKQCTDLGWKSGLTVTGGEPFAQAELTDFLRAAREMGCPHVVVYSGYTLEELLEMPAAGEVLPLVDVLVDGPFIRECADEDLAYRGSSNQRVLDMPATLRAGRPVLLDWDSRQVIVIDDGVAIIPQSLEGLATVLGLYSREVDAVSCAGGNLVRDETTLGQPVVVELTDPPRRDFQWKKRVSLWRMQQSKRLSSLHRTERGR